MRTPSGPSEKCRFRAAALLTTVCCVLLAAPGLSAAETQNTARPATAGTAQGQTPETLTRPVRTAAFEGGRVFFNTDRRTGIRSGYAYQYLTDLSNLAGLQFSYDECSWSQAYDKLLEGKIDLLAEVSWTPERSGQMLFSELPMGTETYCLFTPAGSPLSNPSALDGKCIAVWRESVTGDYLREFLAQKNINSTVVLYDTDAELHDLLRTGKAAAFAHTGVKAEDGYRTLCVFAETNYYIGISKDRPDLKKAIDAAMQRLRSVNPYYEAELSKKYMTARTQTRTLSAQERQWIAANRDLRVGYLDNCLPYSAAGASGRPVGVLGSAVKTLEGRFGFRVTAVPFNTSMDMAQALKDGTVDAAFGLTDSQWITENAGLAVCEPLLSDSLVLIYHDHFEASLRGKIGVSDENRFNAQSLRAKLPDAELRACGSITACLGTVLSGENDGVIGSAGRLYRTLNGNSDYARLRISSTGQSRDFSFAVKKHRPELFSILTRLNRFYSEKELSGIVTHYIAGERQMTLRDFVSFHATKVITAIILVSLLITGLILFAWLRTRYLYQLSYLDALTCLRNRNAYEKKLTELRENPSAALGVVFADINGLKEVNDLQGHSAGDKRIQDAAACLLAHFEKHDICRISGDEFVVLVRGCKEADFTAQFRDFIAKNTAEYGELLAAGMVYAETPYHVQQLVEEAESRMYAMKKAYYENHPDKNRRGTGPR